MGKPLMLRQDDAERIERLKRRIGAKTKVEVVRSALDLLERETERAVRVRRWQRAARTVADESGRVLREFAPGSRLKRIE
ncbi:MAG: hypothetical protein AB1689_02270 [Thermodesulfobacteriota bacterium]